jgi:hypothetical protein
MVKTIDLGRWLEENGKTPLLIKMDIEGHEVEVIDALRDVWKRPCVLFLETHAKSGHDERVLAQLQQAGFQYKLLRIHELPGDSRVFKEYLAILPDN